MLRLIPFSVVILILSAVCCAQEAKLVVHEWGTFTSLQDESGRAIGGINQDVETLPPFVVDLMPDNSGGKGLPVSPQVTMRLETPVVYFHLPQGSPPMRLSFSATFNGGLLTQFYPKATATPATRNITASTQGSLTWSDFTIGQPASGPATDSPIWLAPRNVDASDITTVDGQSERYLFYRGVGSLDSPIKVVRDGQTLELRQNQTDASYATPAALQIQQIWYFDLRTDGKSAYRKIAVSTENDPSKALASTPASFSESDYSTSALTTLRADMKQALISAGLFDDEAIAMLKTWEKAYFQSPGARVFFIVPRAWTDHYLPINVSVPASIERVMVGRIDLVTPHQRQIAADILNKKPGIDLRQLTPELGRFATQIIQNTASQSH